VGEHKPVLTGHSEWFDKQQPDLVVVRCTRHYNGTKTDEILGTFKWDDWKGSAKCFDTEIARIVKEVIPDAHWHDYDGLSELYSKAMKIMMEDKSIPFTYAATFKADFLMEVHDSG
jgi:hypothetical protein